MKIVIIGSVAAGTSVAAKIRRNDENCQIKIFEKDTDISYSSCGLPYFIGEDYIGRDNITPRNPSWFKKRFNFDIFTAHEVLSIDHINKKLEIISINSGDTFTESYDKLVIATGAKVNLPKLPNLDWENTFVLKNVHDADRMKEFIRKKSPQKALIVGSGFIGLEILDNLHKLNIETTTLELSKRLMPHLDPNMSVYLENYLSKKGINFILGEELVEIKGNKAITCEKKELEFDMLIFAIGVKPNTDLVKDLPIKLGAHGGIIVNENLESSISDIYAVGDVCEHKSIIDGSEIYRPLGSTANKMGRILGDVLTGKGNNFRGVLGTSIFKVFDMAIAYTGFTEKEARKKGYNIEVIHNLKEDKSVYFAESKQIVIKAIADRKTEKLLGVQIIGEAGVDKRIDVFVTAMTFGAKVSDLFHLDLAYAPPFSTTKDPVMYTGMILDNAINHNRPILTVEELKANREKYTVIDVRSEKDFEKGHIEGAINIPLEKIRTTDLNIPKDTPIVTHCNKGVTGNAGQNLLINLGYTEVYNLSGGYKNYAMQKNLK
ncbi:MAG: FAD-dependent oxidoreductase [Fusobacteriaceae bacterium]|nr:FAD-dependent oxidoreductase [Fusobacteriaceae bacterium]MBN2839034.1 FAD-dependent oxidoreductase [Fusobacteriaceae bacterium]